MESFGARLMNRRKSAAFGNTFERSKLPAIKELRWCLVSGGVFRHSDTSKVDVAEAREARGAFLDALFSRTVLVFYLFGGLLACFW